MFAPDFRDGGPARVLVCPLDGFRKNRKGFPYHSSAVAVSESPRLIAGTFNPDAESWELIISWIIGRRAELEEEVLLLND